MFCNNCGNANADNVRFCVNCGSAMVAPTTVVNPAQVMGAATAPAPVPPQPTAAAPQPQNPWLAVPPPQAPVRTSGKAVASLILGIVNALFLFVFFPIGILAVVFGHLGRTEVKRSNGAIGGGGMAMAGLVLGYMSIACVPFILIIAAIAIPNLLSARKSANESSAVGSLRTINTACVSYQATYPAKGYPASLRALGSSPTGTESADGAGYIDDTLASGVKNGYIFTYTPGEPDANGVISTYTVTATPLSPGATGSHGFFTDESAVIRSEINGPPTANSPPLN